MISSSKIFSNVLSIVKAIGQWLRYNAQTNQTAIVALVLSIGVLYYGFYLDIYKILATIWTILILEIAIQIYKYWVGSIRFSGAFNALWGISFFLRSDEIIIYILAGALAILWKYTFTTQEGRHFMNPSNMAVTFCLIFFPLIVWTNPLQWGIYSTPEKTILIYIAIFLLGALISTRVQRLMHIPIWITTLSFFLTQAFIFAFFTEETTWQQALIYFNPGFFVFIFFMITDPKTVPWTKIGHILHGMGIGILFFILQYYINENYSNLLALFCMTLFLPFIWKLESKQWLFGLNQAHILQLGILLIFIHLFAYNIYQNWFPDLIFDNRCRQLFCE